jgi:hypothetical protein
MGNKQSNSTESIGFKDTNVNAYSATLPGSFQINQEINAVIDNLPVHNENTLSPPPTKAINPSGQLDLQLGGGCGDEDSSIVSLGLADIFFKKNDIQLGGGGCGGDDEEKSELENNAISNTSPFISSEMYNFLMKGGGAKKSKKSKKSKKGKKTKKQDTETSLTVDSSPVPGEVEDSDVNYMSSSAHTGMDSESDNEDMKFKQVSSVNTSDIKLVTEN